MIADHAEGTFALLRYLFGGNRPSQTDPLTLSHTWITGGVRIPVNQDWYFTVGSTLPNERVSMPPSYATHNQLEPNIRLQ